MNHLFVSDAHIGAFSEVKNRRIEDDLIALIQYCRRYNYHIHILGDLFDYWMEYPLKKPELGKHVLKSIDEYCRDVAPITYILGNHDNWTRGFFAEIGMKTANDFHVLQENDTSFFLHHGDGLSDPEFQLPRPLFHRVLRSNWFTKIYQTIYPPDAGLHLMKSFSAFSRETIVFEPERLNKWSENFLRDRSFDVVISGHDHIPRVETFEHGTYINLGAFYKHHTVATYTNGSLELVKWITDKFELFPFQRSLKIQPAYE